MKTLNISSDPTGVLDLVSIGIAIVDTSPRILEMNHTFCEMYGYSRIELLEMDLERLTASSNTRVFDQALRYIRAEEGFVETAMGCGGTAAGSSPSSVGGRSRAAVRAPG